MKRSEVNNKIASDGILISSVDFEYGYLSDNGKILLVTYSLPNATDTELVVSEVEFIDTGDFLLHSLSYLQPVTDVNRSDVEKLEIGMTVSMACSILGGSGEVNDTDEQTITYGVSDGSVLTLKYGYAKGGFKKWDNWRILDIQILTER
jgi:hypothetical protein